VQNSKNVDNTGTLIDDVTGTLFVQRSEHGGAIAVAGDNVRDNHFVQWHGGHNTVYMKDGKDITGNRFFGGFEEGLKYSIGKMVDLVEQPIRNMVGKPYPRRLEDDTIVLEGKREDYTFKFNNDYKPYYGNYDGSVDITHLPTGATNNSDFSVS